MRKLRVVFTTVGGAMPALLVALVTPAVDACGGGPEYDALEASNDGGRGDEAFPEPDEPPPPPPDWDASCPSYIVEIPEPGTAADPGLLCAVPSPVASNVSARVTLSDYSQGDLTATGVIEVPAAIESTVVGLPTVSVRSASSDAVSAMTVTEMTKTAAGFRFRAHWPEYFAHWPGATQMTVVTTFTVACDDGGTTTVEALTKIDLCHPEELGSYEWVSSGDACTDCQIIAEMAPSPIVSDKKGDDLPLGMVLRLRVVEVARAGRQVLLFADNDAGAAAEYEWRVSEGSIEHIAQDVVLWTLPDDATSRSGARTPFGQVAVWNDDGAAVENFVFSVAWQEAA